MGVTNTNVLTLFPKNLMISYGLVVHQVSEVSVKPRHYFCLSLFGLEGRVEVQICHLQAYGMTPYRCVDCIQYTSAINNIQNTNVLTLSPKDLMTSYRFVVHQVPEVSVKPRHCVCLSSFGLERRVQICHLQAYGMTPYRCVDCIQYTSATNNIQNRGNFVKTWIWVTTVVVQMQQIIPQLSKFINGCHQYQCAYPVSKRSFDILWVGCAPKNTKYQK